MDPLRKAPSLSCRYAIYSYNPQRCKEFFQNGQRLVPEEASVDLDDSTAMNQTSSFGILPDVSSDEEGLGNTMWCLSLVCGNLEPDLEVDLRPFVAKRIGKGLLGVGSTTVSPMDFKLPSETGRVVPLAHSFCTMLNPGVTAVNASIQSANGAEDDLKIIICLLCSSSHLLRAYNMELLQFCRQIAAEIDPTSTEIPKETKTKMTTWDNNTHYLSDCLSVLGQENTALLLQAILEDRQLQICCEDDPDLQSKLSQLWDAFNISKIVGPKAKRSGEEETSEPSLVLRENSATFFGFDRSPSKFAAEWARVLHNHVHDNVKLKDHFDAYNGKIVQILNNLKRLIKAGEASYHALFRSSMFLRWTGAPITFLNHVKDQAEASDIEALEVIDVLREFLAEEGFQD